jgi:Fe-S cluster biosynthesis and repair protein YggX
MPRTVQCVKLGREAEGLEFPPYPGELGRRIYENVSKEAWKQWLEHQKMLVNENRLNLADKKARDYLSQQMEKHFFGEGADRRLRAAQSLSRAAERGRRVAWDSHAVRWTQLILSGISAENRVIGPRFFQVISLN